MQNCGGLSEYKPAGKDINDLCYQVKDQVEAKYGVGDRYEPVEYRIEVVAGYLYHVKIQVTKDKTIQVIIHRPLAMPGKEPELKLL